MGVEGWWVLFTHPTPQGKGTRDGPALKEARRPQVWSLWKWVRK